MLTRRIIEKAPLGEAKGNNIQVEDSPANVQNISDIQIFEWCLSQHERRRSFTNGTRNAFITSLAAFCNEKGVTEATVLNECINRFTQPDFTQSEIRATVRSIYAGKAHLFNSKPFQSGKHDQTKVRPKSENIFLLRTANRCIADASQRKNPDQLCSEFWHEGEVCILFAGAGTGKSLLSVQIGDAITRGGYSDFFRIQAPAQGVLYFDFELSEKQFQKRYSDQYRDVYQFRETFFRAEIDPDAENFSDENLYFSIEDAIQRTSSKILIMDNITYLKTGLEESKHALPLMKYLKQLKKRLGLSILVLAHTPKRDQTRQITINDLAGSSQLANFADAIFCINTSARDKSIRYLKQIKARNTEIVYDADNVALFEIRNDHNFTGFHFLGFDKEQAHLKELSEKESSNTESAIIELYKAGKSYRVISNDLNISLAKVQRTIEKSKKNENEV